MTAAEREENARKWAIFSEEQNAAFRKAQEEKKKRAADLAEKIKEKQELDHAQNMFRYPPHIMLTSLEEWTSTDCWVEIDSGYATGLNKTKRQAHDLQIVDPHRYQISTKLNFKLVVEGPELVRSDFYVCFGPITADILDGVFIYIYIYSCACDMERVPRDRSQGDSECARMSFGVYKTQPENAELARMFESFECDLCGQDGNYCRLVYHCPDCDEVYCQQCAREIPQNPRQRMERIKIQAELQENKLHWINQTGKSDLERLDEKLAKHPRLTNVTFDSCIRDGCKPGSFPFETDIYCKEVDDEWPIGIMKPFRKWDPMNADRKVTRLQNTDTNRAARRWDKKKNTIE